MKTLIQKLGVSAAMLLTFLSASAYDFKVDGIYYTILSLQDLTCEVVAGDKKYTGDVVIPAEVTYNNRTLSVTKIEDRAFYECSSLTSIKIPNSVTEIGRFDGCSSLTSIDIPNSATKVGSFNECSSLTSIKIPNSVTEIGSFTNCFSLTSIDIPNNIKTLPSFFGCSRLQSIEIPNSVTIIGSFFGCSSLTSIKIPNSVTKIGSECFRGCISLSSIEIPNSVTIIAQSAFYSCHSLKSIKIPNSVTSIRYQVFEDCSSLTSIDIPDSITEIEYSAFENCASLASIHIPDLVTKIGRNAFRGCSSLKSIEIPNSVTEIGRTAFYGCSSLSSIQLSNQLKRIEFGLFKGCQNLQSITIPGSVAEIDQYCIRPDSCSTFDCANLNTLTIEYSDNVLVSSYYINNYPGSEFISFKWGDWTNQLEYVTFDRAMRYEMPLPNLKELVLGEHLEKVQVKNISTCDKLEAIQCRSLTPPSVEEFSNAQYINIKVRVPEEALDAYKQHQVWGKFWNLASENNISINSTEIKETGRYDLYGRSVSEDYQGMVIIRYSDGTSRKVFVK